MSKNKTEVVVDCEMCGDEATLYTSAVQTYSDDYAWTAYDSDDVKCSHCGAKGCVNVVDENYAYIDFIEHENQNNEQD